MTEQLQIRTRQHQPIAVAEFHGPLTGATVASLSDALREHTAEQPTALVLDLTSARCPVGEAIDALRDATHSVHECSGVPMIVLAPDDTLADALRRAGIGEHTTLTMDRDEAFAVAAEYPAPRRRRLEGLPPDPHVLRLVRRTVAEACHSWGVGHTAEAAQLAASELVSNSVEHARTPSDLTLAVRADNLHIVVRDGSPVLPQSPADPDLFDPRGRGLVLIDELAAAWASIRTATGKLVWAVLPIERSPTTSARAGPHAGSGSHGGGGSGRGSAGSERSRSAIGRSRLCRHG